MTSPGNSIYLASRSSRRRELLTQIGVSFETLLLREAPPRGADIDETPFSGEAPAGYVSRIACIKAELSRRWLIERGGPLRPVLGADTAVVFRGRIFGKPASPAHAGEMLAALSGQTHEVLTAIAVAAEKETRTRTSTSIVRFRDISEREILRYLALDEAHDKAGGYAIQGVAAVFVTEIVGSYSGIMGLPLYETARLLQDCGIDIFP
ncbi:MAG: septum formation protein Maf [Nitrosospira sp. 56-18]|jgi:septum formation protein|nr:septum formation inhibitor Maf [Nitrosospira sp.]OJY13718.1 MAG: septum formation protein Maf [Nitrosospira sp. 56-18]